MYQSNLQKLMFKVQKYFLFPVKLRANSRTPEIGEGCWLGTYTSYTVIDTDLNVEISIEYDILTAHTSFVCISS